MNRPIRFLAVCFLATSCAAEHSESAASGRAAVDFTRVATTLEPVEAPGIDKLHTVSGVFLAGQPDASGFRAAKDGGIRTVIDLRHADEVELDEKALVESLGLAYVNLPWNGEDELTDEIFDRSRELLGSVQRPILLHCKSANRAGAVWLPHRVLDGGLSVEDALAEAKSVGLTKAAYEAKALDYVERKQR